MKRFYQLSLVAMINVLAVISLFSQTVLIAPSGDGGFENGATFAANGWTVASDDTNAWYIGPLGANAGTNGAYVDSALGVSNYYRINASQVSHFWRDVAFPAGEGVIQLSFNWRGFGESTYDYIRVYATNTTETPTAGVLLAPTANAQYNQQGSWQSATLYLPDSLAGKTKRLIFTWRNDVSAGTQPPASIDNISLTSQAAVPLSGTYTIDNAFPSSGTNFQSFTAAITAINVNGISGSVTFNVTSGQTFTENTPALTVEGTISNTITFQKSGVGANPIIQPTGTASATDAGITLSGCDYVTFDGIDISVASGTAVEYGFYLINSGATNGAQYNTIKNTSINLNNNTTAANTSSAAIRFTTPTTPTAYTGTNKFNTIRNITTRNAYRGILFNASTTGYRDEGNVVTADPGYSTGTNTVGYNDIGNTTVSQSSGLRGIEINGQQDITISKCEVRNLTNTSTSTTSDIVGIVANSTTSSFNVTISQNLINNIVSASTGTQVVYGMWF